MKESELEKSIRIINKLIDNADTSPPKFASVIVGCAIAHALVLIARAIYYKGE